MHDGKCRICLGSKTNEVHLLHGGDAKTVQGVYKYRIVSNAQKPQSDSDYSIPAGPVRSQLLLPTASACGPSVSPASHARSVFRLKVFEICAVKSVFVSLCLMNTLSAPELEAGSDWSVPDSTVLIRQWTNLTTGSHKPHLSNSVM